VTLARFVSRRHSPRTLLALLLAAACSGETAHDHIYTSRPPAVARPAAPARSAPVAEPAFGSVATARIVSLRVAATGVPASLEDVREPIEVLAVAGHGRTIATSSAARLELALSGPVDTVLVVPLGAPVPLVVTQAFRIEVGPPRGLRPGRYEARARLLGEEGHLIAASIPTAFQVRLQRF
jgi:hypothetical protein